MGKFTEDLNNKLLLVENKHYARDQLNSYMTTFEWENVKDAQRLGQWMQEKNTLFGFPFFKRTFNLLWVTKRSISAANESESLYKILSSEYGVMAMFINFFNVLEFGVKGVAGFFIHPFIKRKNDTVMQGHFAAYFTNYGKNLETIPFYSHQYTNIRLELSEQYQAEKNKGTLSMTDRLTYFVVSNELRFREVISKPLHNKFNQPENIIPATTDILIEYRVDDAMTQEPKAAFDAQLMQIKEEAHVDVVNNHVYVKPKKEGKGYTAIFALLSAPRYGDFVQTTQLLTKSGIKIKKIAGNDSVQVKCDITAKDASGATIEETLCKVENSQLLYKYGDSIHPHYQTCLFKVPVKHLQQVTNDLAQVDKHAKVSFIHNF